MLANVLNTQRLRGAKEFHNRNYKQMYNLQMCCTQCGHETCGHQPWMNPRFVHVCGDRLLNEVRNAPAQKQLQPEQQQSQPHQPLIFSSQQNHAVCVTQPNARISCSTGFTKPLEYNP